MAELTNAQLHQIRQALITGVDLTMYRVDTDTNQAAASEIQAALDIVTKLLEVPAPKVEAAPVAKAKTVKLSPAQRGFMQSIKDHGALGVRWDNPIRRTVNVLVEKKMVHITKHYANYFECDLTELGHNALNS